MIEIRKTDLFAQWIDALRDLQARADHSSGRWRQDNPSQGHQDRFTPRLSSFGVNTYHGQDRDHSL